MKSASNPTAWPRIIGSTVCESDPPKIKTLGGIVLDLEKNVPQQHKPPNPNPKARGTSKKKK
jgi:hypothetical protein